LICEWKPSGPTLRDGVFELADLRWKQRRLKKFVQTKLSLTTFDPRSPAFDEDLGLLAFAHYLRSEPETCFEQRASNFLRPDKINYLKQKFPRPNYQSTSEWAETVIKEVYLLSVQTVPQSEIPETIAELGNKFKEAFREWKAECQVAGTITLVSELLEYELKQGELLEARIARKIKSLFELKTMEQMLAQT
jgi:gas vesicle protein